MEVWDCLRWRKVLLFVVEFAQANRGDDFFRVKREVAVHHPCIVTRFGSEYLGYRASLVLAEAEHFDPFLVEDDSARVSASAEWASSSSFPQ